jgi:hypothetical protein
LTVTTAINVANPNRSSPTNVTIADGQGVGTIVDDEPGISISDVTKQEGKKVTMSFATVNGTATTSDGDYVANTGTLLSERLADC